MRAAWSLQKRLLEYALGHLLSLKPRMNYEALVTTQIAQPVQMQSTKIQVSAEMKSCFAEGHNAIGQPAKNWDMPTLAGAGALRSTTNDLLNFLAANMSLTESSLRPVMQKTHTIQRQTDTLDLGIGLDWQGYQKYGTEIVWHNGMTGGYYSFIGFDKKKQLGVVILSNSSNSVDDIGLYLLGKQFPLEKFTTVNSKLYNAYVGHYELSPELILTITKAENRLFVQATGQQIVELSPESETNFSVKIVDAQITFIKDQQGQVNQLILHQSGQSTPAKRIR